MTAFELVQGEMQLAGRQAVDGWCWCPDRPKARLPVEVLVDDRVVARAAADLFRDDLRQRGIGDGRHAFVAQLPAPALPTGAHCLVSAREATGGVVFGRTLHAPSFPTPEPAPETALRAGLDRLSASLAQAVQGKPPSAMGRLRGALAELAAVLQARADGGSAAVAGARAALAGLGPAMALPRPARPAASLVIAAATVGAALDQLRRCGPAAWALDAEVLLVDTGGDAGMVLLPGVVRGLRLLPGPCDPGALACATAALPLARGGWLVVLDPNGPPPSGTALQFVLARMAADGVALLADWEWIGTVLEAPSSTGLGLAVRLHGALPTGSDLRSPSGLEDWARRHDGGIARVIEPWPPLAAAGRLA